jgi:hypothetical protein
MKRKYYNSLLKRCFILLFFLFSGCSVGNERKLDIEYHVKMSSYYNGKVAKALYEDITSHINASYLNLETGEMDENKKPDIFYALSCGSICNPVILAMDKVKIEDFGLEKPQKNECESTLKNNRPQWTVGGSVTPRDGWYSCVRTNHGHIGWIRFDKEITKKMEHWEIQLTYWLWK